VVAINGPIMFFIPKDNVDTNIWDIPDGFLNKPKKKKLMANDFIKIQVIDKRINQNDSQIKAIGKLLDFATPEEVDKYFGSKIITEKIIDDTRVAIVVDQPEQMETVNTEEAETESNFII
jgi:hypothetical protein